MSNLAPLFAQVRSDIAECCHDCDDGCQRDKTVAALSSIERHVQDMETALRGLLVETEPEQHRGTEPHPERGMCVWCDARAALAGPGSEQSSLTESGSAGLPDTPADDEPCSCCDGEGCAYCTPADNQEDKT